MKISRDTAVVLLIVFLASLAANVYQYRREQQLFQTYVDIEWERQGLEANLQLMSARYEDCQARLPPRQGTEDNREVNP